MIGSPERKSKLEAMQFAVKNGPAIILVRPQLGENIGAAARAMLNCGLTKLRIVDPRDGWPNIKALNASSGADAVIGEALIFDNVPDAVADLDLIFATTSRARDQVKDVTFPDQAFLRLPQQIHVGIMFGSERNGLDNDDICVADSIIEIPLNPAFPSLNLAQAVLLVSYEWRRTYVKNDQPSVVMRTAAKKSDIISFFNMLEEELESRGFYPSPSMQQRMARNMRNMFQRIQLSQQDIQSLYGIVKALGRSEPDRKA